MKKPMTLSTWEKTATDKRMDRAQAKKAGGSLSKWERSAADKKVDKAMVAKANARKR